RRAWPARPTRRRERASDALRELRYRARASRQTMIRTRPGRRGHRFDRIETVHAIGLLGPASRGEIFRVAERAGRAAEEVGVEREDHVGLIEAVLHVRVLAEREL